MPARRAALLSIIGLATVAAGFAIGFLGRDRLAAQTNPNPPVCGNGSTETGETCDPPSTAAYCSSTCQFLYPPPAGYPCGNGIVDADRGEDCDDGNRNDGDGCSGGCGLESCYCTSGCSGSYTCNFGCGAQQCAGVCQIYQEENCGGGYQCGNGVKDPGEQCDYNASGPDELCFWPENGQMVGHDTCPLECMCVNMQFCGNGQMNTGEQCDDGNEQNGDGCDDTCYLESGTASSSKPSSSQAPSSASSSKPNSSPRSSSRHSFRLYTAVCPRA